MIIPNTINNIIMNQTCMITIATTLWVITTIIIINRAKKALILLSKEEL